MERSGRRNTLRTRRVDRCAMRSICAAAWIISRCAKPGRGTIKAALSGTCGGLSKNGKAGLFWHSEKSVRNPCSLFLLFRLTGSFVRPTESRAPCAFHFIPLRCIPATALLAGPPTSCAVTLAFRHNPSENAIDKPIWVTSPPFALVRRALLPCWAAR